VNNRRSPVNFTEFPRFPTIINIRAPKTTCGAERHPINQIWIREICGSFTAPC
jgi:hypothetical protein